MDKESLLNFVSKLHVNLVSLGMQTQEVADIFKEAGYTVTKRHLNRLKAQISSTGRATVEVKNVRSGKKISDEEMDQLYEWIKEKNDNNERVRRRDVRKYLNDEFGIQVSKSSVWRYLSEMGITDKVVNNRNPANKLSRDERKQIIWRWLKKMTSSKHGNRMNLPPGKIKSLDVVHDGLPKEKVKTLSPSGAGRPAVNLTKRKYVNSYVTIVDGTSEWKDKVVCFTQPPAQSKPEKHPSRTQD